MEHEIHSSPLFPEFTSRMTELTVPNEFTKLTSTPFRYALNGTSVEFRPEKLIDKSNHIFGKPFDKLLKGALMDKPDAIEEVEWMKMNRRLSRPQKEKKNADVCLAYRFGNMYLTKKYFTFGIMRTKPGKCHVYQNGNKPLLFYLPKSSSYEYPEKTFKCMNRSEFNCFVLEPNSTYMVGQKKTYLIITIDESLFTVDILDISDFKFMNCKNPTEKTFKQYKEQRLNSTLRDVTFNHSLQGTQNAATTSQAFQDVGNLLTPNPPRSQPPDNNMTMCSVENSLEASGGQSTPKSRPGDRSVTNKGEILKQSKKRKHESTGEEMNVSRCRQSQERQSSSEQGAQLEISRHSPSHRNGQLVEQGTLRKSSDRYARTSSNTAQKNTTESANSRTLTETRESEEDEPSSYIKDDGFGNKYEFKFIDTNWGENEPQPLDIFPYKKRIKGRCYVVVPIKI